jgi:outer membrane protein assembly factor BamD
LKKRKNRMTTRPLFLPVLMLCALLSVSACSSTPTTDTAAEEAARQAAQTGELPPGENIADAADVEKPETVEAMYNVAAAKMDNEEYFEAARLFDEVDRQYPYSQWAGRAQLMAGFAHYKRLKYDESVMALDRFIELHPGNENVAYAYYLKALCFYEQISDVRRDQKMTEMALDNLRQVVERFPESRYAKDAALKIDLTTDHLAGKEMEIGRYYLERRQYQASINRFERVVNRYQTTTHVPEALHRLVESYTALGIPDEARKNAAILGHNYPHSVWYKDSYRLLGGKIDTAEAPQKKTLYDKTLGKIF